MKRSSVLGYGADGQERSLTLKLWLAQDSEADKLLAENPFALLVGMVLDQQIPLEKAFRGPKVIEDRMSLAGPRKIADRMGGFDAGDIADYDPDKFAALCSERPAIHRFPAAMAKRIQALAQIIVDRYNGDAAAIWTAGDPDGKELLRRLKGLPGFGEQKARIFLALLGKQYGVTPPGWQEAAGDFGRPGTHLSVADIVDAQSLGKVRSYKKQMKAAAKSAQGKAAT
ncbi:HhH-GPD-type base excision DNA repair protein [Mycobacterium sp. 1423905.2]|uniref:HhH-GPD-type base excision DNA repair protein n=1 Tax=Mycobacterium sp. 1423905.2 TaxID=1856859 RepID=UPI0007FB8AEE|nr:HhH-GPD-type base excision DNA repair protein [Mycobacterium sp. 1423905.2]OBJ58204.1 Fe-S cluster assembly protein HesB [Mycobacterium sp. 1423905.2]